MKILYFYLFMTFLLTNGLWAKVISYPDYPVAHQAYWTKNLQGISSDKDFWYIITTNTITKYPIFMPLEWLTDIPTNPNEFITIPHSLTRTGYSHLGASDIYGNYLYVPVEGSTPQVVARFNRRDLSLDSVAPLPNFMTELPMLAINKESGILYTNHFNLNSKNHIYGFKIVELVNGFRLDHVETTDVYLGPSPIYLKKIQGAAFTEDSKKIIFVCDHKGGGLFIFDWKSKRLVDRKEIKFSPGFPFYEELEGLTISKEAGLHAPIVEGTIHVGLLDNELFDNDEASVLHFELE